MQKTAINNLVLTDLSSLRWSPESLKHIVHAGFYQQLVALGVIQGLWTREIFDEIGRKLVAQAEYAYALRHLDKVEQICQSLTNLPLSAEFKNIALHFQALCFFQKGQWTQAYALSEKVSKDAPMKFRARALLTMGSIRSYGGDHLSALSMFVEAGRAASAWRDSFAMIQAKRAVAIVKSINGDHRGSLEDLENMLPMVSAVRSLHPSAYYEHLNSLAVEMMEAGRFEEARNASRIAIRSPFASAHPEWQDTIEEINLRVYRSSRAVTLPPQYVSKTNNLLRLPERSGGSRLAKPARKDISARILNYSEWKKKMGKKSDNNQTNADEEMTEKEMFLRVIELTSQQDLTEKKLRKILEAVKKIVSEPDED